jgi:hypothetical protein
VNLTQPSPTAVAYSFDKGDGTYKLDFVRSPYSAPNASVSGEGTLRVAFEYTCGFGAIPPPLKSKWRSGGALMVKYNSTTVPSPPIRPFQRPNQQQDSSSVIHLGKYKRIVCYGDSNLERFITNAPEKLKSVLWWDHNVNAPLHHQSLRKRFLRWIPQYLTTAQALFPNETVALLVGSHTWDVVFGTTSSFAGDHIRSVQKLLKTLQTDFPNVHLYWYSGYALQLHVAAERDNWADVVPLKYMSYSRSQELYRLQIQLMKRLGIPVVDGFEASYLSAEMTPSGDARHYNERFYNTVLQWYFFPE